MKRSKIVIIFMLGGLLLLPNAFSSADAVVYAAEVPSYAMTTSKITLYAEQTEWKYRVVDGKPQKRLWSLTYGKWLTDWEWA